MSTPTQATILTPTDNSGVKGTSRSKHKALLIAGGGVFVVLLALVAVTFATARHWTVVDVPEQQETFYNEEYETGTYVVLDDENVPCAVGQSWASCISAYVDEVDDACVDVELTPMSKSICNDYKDLINSMREDGVGGEIAERGSYGELTRYALTDVRRVSNGDYRAAETHDATCYLGFIGECDDPSEPKETPLNSEYETGVYMVVADGANTCEKLKPSDCLKAEKAEYEETCGTLTKAELTEASYAICVGVARSIEETPRVSEAEDVVGSHYSPFGNLTRIPITAVRQASAADQTPDATAADRAKEMLRDALNSAETVKMRARYEGELAKGRTEEQLIAEVEDDLNDGLIAKPTACAFLGFIHNQPDEVIIETCSTHMEALLTGEDREWGKAAPGAA